MMMKSSFNNSTNAPQYGNSPRDHHLFNSNQSSHHHPYLSNNHQQQQQQQHNYSSSTTSPVMNTPLNVQRIANSCGSSGDAVVMVKLTDEMFLALEACQKSGKKIRVHVEEQGGTIEIGDGAASSNTNNTFRFQKQVMPSSTDALVQTGNTIRNVGTYKMKYQIQATDRSFEETRRKAEKRAEVEKQRGTKEVKKSVAPTSSRYLSSSSSSTPRGSSSASISSGSSRVSPSFMSSSKASTSSQKSATTNAPPDMMKSKLLSQSLRKRIIHLIVTQKYKTWDDIYAKLLADGLPSDDRNTARIQELVQKLAENGDGTGPLTLQPNYWPELDARWPFYNQEEKEMVRKLQMGSNGASRTGSSMGQDSSFAPTRKKGMEKMTASSRQKPTEKSDKEKLTPEKILTPSPPIPTKMEVDDDIVVPIQGVKRKAHAPPPPSSMPSGQSSQQPLEKRARRNDSTSPPGDAMMNMNGVNGRSSSAAVAVQQVVNEMKLHNIPPPTHQNSHYHHHNNHHHHQHANNTTKNVATNGGGSTGSSRISSPASSLSSPSQPSCDWEKEFGDIKSKTQAEQYFGIFQKEYPVYMDCYRKLTDVSKEFVLLERRLTKANDMSKKIGSGASGNKEIHEIERAIQSRYGDYEKDPEFMRVRQRHTDLRSKLAVLKNRISNWKPSSSSSSSS